MTNESQPGLGSGALREALAELRSYVENEQAAYVYQTRMERFCEQVLTDIAAIDTSLAALSLSSPIEPEPQPNLLAAAKLILPEQRSLTPEESASMKAFYGKVYKPLAGAQASSEVRERFDYRGFATKALHVPAWEHHWIGAHYEASLDRVTEVMREVVDAVLMARQGAGGK